MKSLLLVILMSSSCLAYPKLYIALNHNKASSQFRTAINTNYLLLGSDEYSYYMDEWRNSLVSKVDLEFIEWPNHNVIDCPAVKFGEYPHFQSLPNGEFAEVECWLFFMEYLVDIFEFEKRRDKWKDEYQTIMEVLIRRSYSYYEDCYYRENDYDLIINGVIQKLKYSRPPAPRPIPCPIPNWEYE